MTLATAHVVTALFDDVKHRDDVPLGTREDSIWTYAYDVDDRARMVDAVLGPALLHPRLQAERQVYVWDRPCRSDRVLSEQDGFIAWHSEGEDEFPHQCLRVVIEPGRRFGAAHFFGPTAHGDIGIWVARSRNAVTAEDPLRYSSHGDTEFPADALMPLADLRPIVAEHVETGVRPECVDWQPFHVL